MLEAPFNPYGIAFRNACSYDIEATIPQRSRYEYQKYFPKAYLSPEGIPMMKLKPGENIWLLAGTVHPDYLKNVDFWQEIIPEDETFTIKANNNSRTLNKHQIIELLKNNEAHAKDDVPDWVIYDPSLCP